MAISPAALGGQCIDSPCATATPSSINPPMNICSAMNSIELKRVSMLRK
jgi:hypothetical protein